MVEIIWAIRAYEHINEIAEYIHKDSPFQAKRVVQLIIRETQRLKTNIRIGQMVPELHKDHYREIRVFNYRILYTILNENKIAIIGIVHIKRILNLNLLE